MKTKITHLFTDQEDLDAYLDNHQALPKYKSAVNDMYNELRSKVKNGNHSNGAQKIYESVFDRFWVILKENEIEDVV